jgi:endoglucanase
VSSASAKERPAQTELLAMPPSSGKLNNSNTPFSFIRPEIGLSPLSISAIICANSSSVNVLGSRFFEDASVYIDAALEHVHYLLGRNPLSQSYITGFGSNASKHPHHRPSVAVGSAVPGMVIGGPNMNTQQDRALQTHCTGLPPSKCYIDHKDSFASNEITIYWNSTVYFVAAVLGF